MALIPISAKIIDDYYEVLNRIGNLGPSPENGFLRAAYSNEETTAMKFIEEQALGAGLVSRWDAVRNLVIETRGSYAEWAECGSHLDTVPHGGNFDGAAGVVAGLAALRQLLAAGLTLKRGLRLRVWRAEESSTFNIMTAGSGAAFAKIRPEQLENSFQGRTFAEAIASQGGDPAAVARRERIIKPEELDGIACHLELHIEQGNFLEQEEADIGVVTSIRGPYRARVVLRGEFDHSGGTPMGLKYRKDVNLALGYMLVRFDELGKAKIAQGHDLVQTIGVINSSRDFNEKTSEVYQNAIPKVSGYGYFGMEFRTNNSAFLREYRAEVEELMLQTAGEFNVAAEIQPVTFSPGLDLLNRQIQDATEASARVLGFKAMRMASGAVHDCVNLGQQKKSDGSAVPVGMIFIPCRRGKSHSPDEYATSEQIAKGASVLAEVLRRFVTE